MESDSPSPRTLKKSSRNRSGLVGAAAAIVLFLAWAAVAYATVGSEPAAAAESLASASDGGSSGSLVGVAGLVLAGFLPALLWLAREGRSRPTLTPNLD